MSVYLQQPGANNQHDYTHYVTPQLSQAQVRTTLVGNGIQAKYSLGEWTPAQKSRLVIITLLAVGAIAAVAALAIALTISKPFLIAAVIFSAATGFGIYHLCTRGPDFDDPVVRARQIVKISNMPFRTLADDYASEDIVRYNLLNAKVNQMSEATIQRVYAYVNELMQAKNGLDHAIRRDKDAADATFRAATAPARHVRDMRQNESDLRRRTVEVAAQYHPHVAASAQRDVYEVMENINEAGIKSDYDASVANWDGWLTRENARIDLAYNAAMDVLQMHYQRAFDSPNLIPVM